MWRKRVAYLALLALAMALAAGSPGAAHATAPPIPPAPLNATAPSDSGADTYPDLATNGAGTWLAVWQSNEGLGDDGDILFARSDDGGTSWSAPAPLNTNAASDSGADSFPQVEPDGDGGWIAVWESNEPLGEIGADADILFARSADGESWSVPAALNTSAATDSGQDSSPQMTASPGVLLAVWHSTDTLGATIGSDADILFSRSTDSGASWSAPAALNTNAAADSGFDLYPQAATDGNGNWVAAWESTDTLGGSVGPDLDVFVSRSANEGATWSAPAALNTNAGSDVGFDIAVQLTTDGAGAWLAVWESSDDLGGTIGGDEDVLFARSTSAGASWTAPAAVNGYADSDNGGDAHPHIATDGLGNWATVWRASDTPSSTAFDIMLSTSADAGESWSAAAQLDAETAFESGDGFRPEIATDGGRWLTAWYYREPAGGPLGSDYDILYSRCSPIDTDGDCASDAADNCPGLANVTQSDTDGDGDGDACDPDIDGDGASNAADPDADGDGVANAAETPCGADPLDGALRPELVDPPFDGLDEDGDGAIDEPLPPVAAAYDCDGDGFAGATEEHVFAAAGARDQSPCLAWPVELYTAGMSANDVDIQDLNSFLAPTRHLDTDVGAYPGDARWDLLPGKGVLGTDINAQDFNGLIVSYPPMFDFQRALDGPTCPWLP